MKAIIQRVVKASVTVGENHISSIGRGICVFLGISTQDTQKDVDYMVRKILNLRLFEDENGCKWNRNVMDKGFEVLCVSQFTLQCTLKGNKPDFHLAMPADLAQPFYHNILEQLRMAYKPELIKDGQFGAYMQVHIQNDGPVTIYLESPASRIDTKQNVIYKDPVLGNVCIVTHTPDHVYAETSSGRIVKLQDRVTSSPSSTTVQGVKSVTEKKT